MGILFDRLCLYCEQNNIPEWFKNIVCDSKIFEFKYNSLEFRDKLIRERFDKGMTRNDIAQELNNCFLPFNNVFFEFNNAGILMSDRDDGKGRMAIGIEQSKDSPKSVIMLATFMGTSVRNNTLSSMSEAHGFSVILNNRAKSYYNKMFAENEQIDDDNIIRNLANHYMGSILILTEINKPKNFIIEESSDGATNRNIKRTSDRPTYTYLNISEISKRYGLTGSNGSSKSSHPRRSHVRILKSDRYKENIGKEIIIPACWVGPSERQEGNKIYRVMLDK